MTHPAMGDFNFDLLRLEFAWIEIKWLEGTLGRSGGVGVDRWHGGSFEWREVCVAEDKTEGPIWRDGIFRILNRYPA